MKLTNRRCQCAGCSEYFNSVGAFDKHRTGSQKKDTRHCRTLDEMEKAGMFFTDKDGERLWYGSKWTEKQVDAP